MKYFNIFSILMYFALLGYSINNYIKFNDGTTELLRAEIANQRLVISEYQRYYEACLSNLNDMERTCHR